MGISMFEIFQYDFMIRAFLVGMAIAVIAPMIGTFLVLRKLSLFADSLSHVALAGVAIGVITGIYPVLAAVVTCVLAAIVIERLRSQGRIHSDAALSLFLSGSLALALILISLAHGFNVNLFNYLFGSITAVESTDVAIIGGLTVIVIITLVIFYKELLYISFDEESAKVSGLPVQRLNMLFMSLAAVTVSLSMRIVGILMVGALMVIPVLSALQISRSFRATMFSSVGFSVVSVFAGLFLSYYLNIVAGGAIIMFALLLFGLAMLFGKLSKAQ